MKISGVLGGLLLLFVSTYAREDLLVTCSEHMLDVRVRRTPVYDNLEIMSFELFLGNDCPVNNILPGYFVFTYPVTSCGIKKHILLWNIVIESSLTYEPMCVNIRGFAQILCSIPRKFESPFAPTLVHGNASRETTTEGIGRETHCTNKEIGGPIQECYLGAVRALFEPSSFSSLVLREIIKL